MERPNRNIDRSFRFIDEHAANSQAAALCDGPGGEAGRDLRPPALPLPAARGGGQILPRIADAIRCRRARQPNRDRTVLDR
jgi:hypothetical protein